MDLYQQYIHKSRYARYFDSFGRRENWSETVFRTVAFLSNHSRFPPDIALLLDKAVRHMEVMPSMRAVMTAGPALERDNVAAYNCSYVTMDHPRAFDEIVYVLMCGTGVGFSVERQYINKLPPVAEDFHETDSVIRVHDSKIGWAKSYRELLSLLWAGQVPRWDLTGVRPSGAPLRTFGGRASGPEPLDALFHYTVAVFKAAAGRKLRSIEVHDIVCKIADIVVVGGVRRSALISLSDLDDDLMRHCKSGNWWQTHPHRALANNSAVYEERPAFDTFLSEWKSLYDSRAGERGIFSRKAAQAVAARNGRRDAERDFGTNPCSEIILRPQQFCNLSEVVVRPEDTLEALMRKVEMATLLGTLQSTLVDFRYLRSVWRKNTEEERLLGVSLTGIMDHKVLNGSEGTEVLEAWLEQMREVAVVTNKFWAERLGIPQSTAITCVKPSGTVSQLVDSASGIHPRFAKFYVRRVRADKKDPLSGALKAAGVPCEDDLYNPTACVFSFPQKAPEGAVTVADTSALSQLRMWEVYQRAWCEHKPSCTVYYRDNEFLDVGAWVWKNLDNLSGISFLPVTDHVYQQAPYEEITEEQYKLLAAAMPESFDWDSVQEQTDATTGVQTLACTGGVCEI